MLGSVSEADDAVQEAWLRLSRSDTSGVENLGGWLTTVVARVCLDMLRSRKARREEPLGPHVPEPIVSREDGADPEHEALLADSVGLALLVVLETLAPAERLAFVLHDMFAVPFDEIAPIVGRSPDRRAAAREPRAPPRARAPRRCPTPTSPASARSSTRSSPPRAAATSTRSLAVLDPDVVLRVDRGAALGPLEGGPRRAGRRRAGAARSRRSSRFARPALVNGAAGFVVARARTAARRRRLHGRATGGSSRSTCSPIRRACERST